MIVDVPIKVRYAETDQMGVVYHANYLLYMEDARTAFLEAAGYPYAQMEELGYLSPVVDAHLHYGSPLRYGDTVIVRTRVISNRPTKTTYAYEFYTQGMDLENDRPLATAESTHCIVEADGFKPTSIKRALPELYALYDTLVEPA
ncbi:MAG: thioesterase family protein [Coriobacteriia bacterium]|nr:thioesterase family protein [Coriobacteriia bacterium]